MKTNKSRRDAASKAKKKAAPPQPAMFRLHSPVTPARVARPAKADGDKKEAKGGAKPEPPAVTSSDAPGEKPNAKSAKKPDDVSSLDQKPSAKKTKGKEKEVNESDKDSITGEINNKKTPREGGSPDESSDNAPKNTAALFADSDDNDEPKLKFPRSAIKRPRNSASAEAYAKKMSEKEESAMGEKSKSAKKRKEKKKKGGEEAADGHVKMKHTPKVPNDAPPRTKSARKKSTSGKKAAASAASNLKSPPEELVSRKKSSRTKKPTEKAAAAAGLKSPPEAELSAKEKDTESDEQPEKKSSSRKKSRSAKKSKAPAEDKGEAATPTRRSKRNTSAVAEELVSNLEEEATNAQRSKRERDPSDEEDEEASDAAEEEATTARRSKRARKPSLVAEETKKNEGEAMALEAVDAVETEPPSSKRKSPARKSSPREAKSAKKEGAFREFLEAKVATTWETRIALLKAHKELYNTCDLTHAPKESIVPQLRNFVLESRKQYKKFQKGKHSTLTAARIAELRALGFDFCPLESGNTKDNHDRRFQQKWDEQFKELEAYKAEHGDCLVSCMGSENVKLGNWVRGQRKLYNKAGREGINPVRLAKLDEIGFDFNPVASGSYIVKKRANMFPRVNANWEKHYNNLVLYKKEHGNIIVSPNAVGWPGLYDWIHCQRKEYKKWEAKDAKALMYDTWITKMNEVGFDWAPMKSDGFSKMLLERQSKHFNDLWHKHYGELETFKKKNGHCYVYRNRSDANQTLAGWIHHQRKYKRKHDQGKNTPLTDERIKLLTDIGLDWNPSLSGDMVNTTQADRVLSDDMDNTAQADRDKEWEALFEQLCTFKEKNGHANPEEAEPQLGSWACQMREFYSQNASGETTTLTDAKIAKLESVGFRFATGV
mmetsp:Transcript_38101/g.66823  ORF Transcript_38101/g.66823 Transcript_38101/m.66823 type:complete len:887 (+) Transcript_38101:149-2809(+)